MVAAAYTLSCLLLLLLNISSCITMRQTQLRLLMSTHARRPSQRLFFRFTWNSKLPLISLERRGTCFFNRLWVFTDTQKTVFIKFEGILLLLLLLLLLLSLSVYNFLTTMFTSHLLNQMVRTRPWRIVSSGQALRPPDDRDLLTQNLISLSLSQDALMTKFWRKSSNAYYRYCRNNIPDTPTQRQTTQKHKL